MGDFNLILAPSEKKRGRPFSPSKGLELSHFMSEVGVLDAGFFGSRFTWCNNRYGQSQIWKRLDKLLNNMNCLNVFSSLSISHLVRDPSDHASLLISFTSRLDNRPRPFRFLNVWTSKDGLLDVIKTAWHIDVMGSPFYVVCSKLKSAGKAIQ